MGQENKPTRVHRPTSPRMFTEQAEEAARSVTPEASQATQPGAEYPRDLVFILRRDGEVVFANRALGGLTAEEVSGTSIYDWVAPDQRAAMREGLEQVFRTGRPVVRDLAGFRHHDPGAWYECRLTASLRDGVAVSATLVAHDITRHRRSLQELRWRYEELERLLDRGAVDLAGRKTTPADRSGAPEAAGLTPGVFRALLDQAGDAIFIIDPSTGTVSDLNETACRWLRKQRSELVGCPVDDLKLEFPIQPPEEVELEFTETRDTRRPMVLEGRHRRSDGSTFPVEVAVARHENGREEYLLAVARDVKGRKRAEDALHETEALYRSIFERSSDAMYLTARNGEVVDANPAALELFGYARDVFVGLDARTLFPRSDDIRRFQHLMGDQGVVEDLDVVLRTSRGTTLQASLSASRRRGPEGSTRGYLCVVRNPVSLKRFEETSAPAAGIAESVLIVGDEPATLSDARAALEEAGMQVFTAESPEGAVALLQQPSGGIVAGVFAADPEEAPWRQVLEEIHRLAPAVPIVMIGAAEPVSLGRQFMDLGVVGVLQRPVHPLALIQRIREARGTGSGH